jgi:transcriptional regulator with XRE-family HTH domain
VSAEPLAALPSPDTSGDGAAVLADLSEAYEYLEACRDRARRAQSILVECVLDARRDHGLKLAEIAAALGVTRQYVQKVIREAERGELEDELYAARAETQARKDERAALAGLQFTPRDRQCGVCNRFKSAPSSVCDYCGDDPVTHNGERRDYDAAYAGGIR